MSRLKFRSFPPSKPKLPIPSNLSPHQYNSLLTSHIRSHCPDSALLLFLHMHSSSILLDSYSFPPILSAASSLRLPTLGPQIHSLLLKSISPSSSPIPFTSLLDFYSKCGLHPLAFKVFHEIPQKDPVVWNSLISSFIRSNCLHGAVSAFHSMVESGMHFTDFTLCSLLKACTELHDLRLGRQIHSWVCVMGWSRSVVMATALVGFYSNCGRVVDALGVFDGLGCGDKDVAICNSLIDGFVANGQFRDAFLMLGRMEVNGVGLSSGLNACSELGSLEYGRQIHCVAERRGFISDFILCNSLLDMYAKCGKLRAARLVFYWIREKGVVSWTSIIDAYGRNGLGVEALSLFEEMKKETDVSPNSVTFLSVLSACGHSGLIEDGRRCFFSMKDKYGIEPGPEHYACYIDLLGRAGKIEEAWDAFCSVDRLASGVCVAMLNACKTSSDFVKGEIVARTLLELDPDNPGVYVLVSNFYADFGRWEEVEGLREKIRARGLRKDVVGEEGGFGSSKQGPVAAETGDNK